MGVNSGTSGGNSFSAFGNLTGTGNNTFTFTNESSITGNLVGGENSTLNVAALASPTVNLSGASTMIGGNISGFNQFIGTDSEGETANSTLISSSNGSTWTLTGNNGGTLNSSQFSGFGNIIGGNSSDTLIGMNTNANFTINGTNAGTVNGLAGGFSQIGNLTGGSGTNTFIFSANGKITGMINGGNTNNINIIDFSGYTQPVTLALSLPVSGNQFNAGTITSGSNTIASMSQIQEMIGNTGWSKYCGCSL